MYHAFNAIRKKHQITTSQNERKRKGKRKKERRVEERER